jgi:soluble cytochrome b562
MSRIARRLATGAALALGIWCMAVSPGFSADDEEDAKAIKAAREGLLKLVNMNGNAAKAQAKAIADASRKAAAGGDEGLKYVMRAYKPRSKDGIGVGAKGESIELKIIALSKRVLPAAEVGKQSKDLEKIASISKAISEVTHHYTPKGKKPGKDPKDWTKYTDEMTKGADELAKAVKSGNAREIKTAATNLNASCTNCHGTFRDAND